MLTIDGNYITLSRTITGAYVVQSHPQTGSKKVEFIDSGGTVFSMWLSPEALAALTPRSNAHERVDNEC